VISYCLSLHLTTLLLFIYIYIYIYIYIFLLQVWNEMVWIRILFDKLLRDKKLLIGRIFLTLFLNLNSNPRWEDENRLTYRIPSNRETKINLSLYISDILTNFIFFFFSYLETITLICYVFVEIKECVKAIRSPCFPKLGQYWNRLSTIYIYI